MSSPEETGTGPVIRDNRRIDPQTGQVRETAKEDAAAAAPQPGTSGRGAARPGRPGKHAASRPGGGDRGREFTTSAPAGGPPSGPGGGEPYSSPPGGAGPLRSAGADGAAGQDPGDDIPPQAGGEAGTGQRGLAEQLAERTSDLQRVTAEYANYRKRVERDRQATREQALANVLSSLLPVLDDIGRAREHGELVGGFKSVGEAFTAVMGKLGLVAFGEEGEPFDPNVHEALAHSYSPAVSEPTCVKILQPGYRVGERILRPARVAVAEPEDGDESPGGPGSGDDTGMRESHPDYD